MWIIIMRIMMLCMHNTFRIKILKSDNEYDDGKKDMMIWLSDNDLEILEDYDNHDDYDDGKKDMMIWMSDNDLENLEDYDNGKKR